MNCSSQGVDPLPDVISIRFPGQHIATAPQPSGRSHETANLGSVVAGSGWIGVTFKAPPQALQPADEFNVNVISYYRRLSERHRLDRQAHRVSVA